jgi:hypothetical protein
MRRISRISLILALLSISACSDPPTAPDASAAFDAEETAALKTSSAGHSSGRFLAAGQLREGPWKVSFAGHVDIDKRGEPRGHWVTHFHSVSLPEFSGKKFVSTQMLGLGFAPSDNPAACIARSNFRVMGTLDGEPGFIVRVLAADAGDIGGDSFDDMRLVLYDLEGTPLYDTSDANPDRPGGDFPSVSDCAGGSRARLDHGVVKMWLPD